MNTVQNIEDTEKFFNQWRIYQRVIEKNYMVHREIIAAYHQFINETLHSPFTVLDLGCGDAYPAAEIYKNSKIVCYTGIDVSETALTTAEQNLSSLSCTKTFINQDLSDAILTYSNEFDLIMTGYSLHHLSHSDKSLFFKHCRNALKPGGFYLMYDIIALPNETREKTLQRHWSLYSQWDYNDDERALIKEHIFEQDYPETHQELLAMAQAQGFSGGKILFTDKHEIFSAFCFF